MRSLDEGWVRLLCWLGDGWDWFVFPSSAGGARVSAEYEVENARRQRAKL